MGGYYIDSSFTDGWLVSSFANMPASNGESLLVWGEGWKEEREEAQCNC